MVDRISNECSDIPKSTLNLAVGELKRIADNAGVDVVKLSEQTAKLIANPVCTEPYEIIPEKSAVVLGLQKQPEKKVFSNKNPIDLYIENITSKKDSDMTHINIVAYGKQLTQSGATDFTNFGTQGELGHQNSGYEYFAELFGFMHLQYRHGKSFYNKSRIDFLDNIKEKENYPPSILVTQRNNEVIFCITRHLNEGVYARSLGLDPRINRPYFEYRAFKFGKDKFIDLSSNLIPWEVSLGRLPQLHNFITTETIKNELTLDMNNTNIDSDLISDNDTLRKNDMVKLFNSSLVLTLTDQPQIIEQDWSLGEKIIFVQMLQDCVSRVNNKLVSWSSDPIVSPNNSIDIVFKNSNESVIDKNNKNWLNYRKISANNFKLTEEEQNFMQTMTNSLSVGKSWIEITSNYKDFVVSNKELLRQISNESQKQRTTSIDEYTIDTKDRTNIVASKFKFLPDNTKETDEFVNLIYPQASKEIQPFFDLPQDYYLGYKNGEYAGSHFNSSKISKSTIFLLNYLYHNVSTSHQFRFGNDIQSSLVENLSTNYVADTGSSIKVNTEALIAILNLSVGFSTAISSNNPTLDKIFTNSFGRADILSSLQEGLAFIDKNDFHMQNNLLYKKKLFGGFDLSDAAKMLIEKSFNHNADTNSIEYLNGWIKFLESYISLRDSMNLR